MAVGRQGLLALRAALLGVGAVQTPCLNAAAWLDSGAASFNNFTGVSAQTRNQFRGPGYFDMDMSLFRTFKIQERVTLAVGIQAFNVFNHPSFGVPDSNLGDSTFGMITSTGTPTKPLMATSWVSIRLHASPAYREDRILRSTDLARVPPKGRRLFYWPRTHK